MILKNQQSMVVLKGTAGVLIVSDNDSLNDDGDFVRGRASSLKTVQNVRI